MIEVRSDQHKQDRMQNCLPDGDPLMAETDSLFFDTALSLQLKKPWTSTLPSKTQNGPDHIDIYKVLTFSCILATKSR